MPINPHSTKASQATSSKGFSIWHSVIVPIAILLVLFTTLEILVRLPAAKRIFPMRSYGNYHAQFEIKWQKLEEYVQENGGVDVIFLGNSMINTGVDPQEFLASYPDAVEANLRVFNFGVEGFTIVPMVEVARLLIDTYHPDTIIFFTEIRDYMAGNGDQVTDKFRSGTWLQYRLGEGSLSGFFIDRSVAMQSLLSWRNWSRADFLDTHLMNLYRWGNTLVSGYEPERHLVKFTGEYPDPNDEADKEYYSIYQDYTVDPARLESLADFLALEKSGTRIWITEFPAYPGFYEYFGGQQVYQAYLQTVSQFISDEGGVFIPPIDPDLIPLSGRSDDHHINYLGAEIYSSLLADQFIQICQTHNLCLVEP